jgi:hypothetical protein
MEAANLFQTFFTADSAEDIIHAFRRLVGKCGVGNGNGNVPAALKVGMMYAGHCRPGQGLLFMRAMHALTVLHARRYAYTHTESSS